MNISFIGFGNMAKAMAKGLIQNKKNIIRAASPSLPFGVNEDGIQTYSDNMAVLPDAEVLILAVKPWQIETVFKQIHSSLSAECLVISIATGIPLTWFSAQSPGTAIVRAMPNIAAAIGQSATPLIANEWVNPKQKQWAEEILTRIGIITWAKEDADIDVFTAFSGSGPAYVCLFIEALVKAGLGLGIPVEIALSFALQTVNGTLSLLNQSELDPSELRKKVTSPAGTTAAAIEVFQTEDFDALITKAVKAAFERAKELGHS